MVYLCEKCGAVFGGLPASGEVVLLDGPPLRHWSTDPSSPSGKRVCGAITIFRSEEEFIRSTGQGVVSYTSYD